MDGHRHVAQLLQVAHERAGPRLYRRNGIAGLTTEYLLGRAGKSLVVWDDDPIVSGETERTTAHLPAPASIDRWLHMMHGQANVDVFAFTQEFLSRMLGVSRIRVNIVMGLEKAGRIKHSRNQMTVLDWKGLEASS